MRFARKQATIDPLHRDISPRLAKFRYLWFLTIVFVMTLVLFNLATLRFVVDGDSMQAHFQNGQFLIVNRVAYNFTEPQRGDIIVFHMPLNAEQDLLKRIIALPAKLSNSAIQKFISTGINYQNRISMSLVYLFIVQMVSGNWV